MDKLSAKLLISAAGAVAMILFCLSMRNFD